MVAPSPTRRSARTPIDTVGRGAGAAGLKPRPTEEAERETVLSVPLVPCGSRQASLSSDTWASPDDQTIADVQFRERQQRAVSGAPRPVLEITTQLSDPGSRIDCGKRGDGATRAHVEIGLRAAPVGTEEAVGAIRWNRKCDHLGRTDRLFELP